MIAKLFPSGVATLVLTAALAMFGFGCSSENRYDGNGNGGYDGAPDTATNGIWQDDTSMGTIPDTLNGTEMGDGSMLQIEIRDDQYEPLEMTVVVGTTVTWTNRDLYPHTVTAGKPGKPSGTFDSGNIQGDQTYSFTFDSPGEYEYYCKIHPRMRGKIIVEEL